MGSKSRYANQKRAKILEYSWKKSSTVYHPTTYMQPINPKLGRVNNLNATLGILQGDGMLHRIAPTSAVTVSSHLGV